MRCAAFVKLLPRLGVPSTVTVSMDIWVAATGTQRHSKVAGTKLRIQSWHGRSSSCCPAQAGWRHTQLAGSADSPSRHSGPASQTGFWGVASSSRISARSRPADMASQVPAPSPNMRHVCAWGAHIDDGKRQQAEPHREPHVEGRRQRLGPCALARLAQQRAGFVRPPHSLCCLLGASCHGVCCCFEREAK
jgi:hypothetical protein